VTAPGTLEPKANGRVTAGQRAANCILRANPALDFHAPNLDLFDRYFFERILVFIPAFFRSSDWVLSRRPPGLPRVAPGGRPVDDSL
jgi:hypothetical protein